MFPVDFLVGIQFPLRIAEDRDPDHHLRICDQKGIVVIRMVVNNRAIADLVVLDLNARWRMQIDWETHAKVA